MVKRIVWTSGSVLILAGALAAIGWRQAAGQTGDSIDFKQLTGQIFDQEPVLFFDVSGFGLGGPIHQRLAVYSSGLASISTAGFVDEGEAEFTFVPMERVAELKADLVAIGIETIEDNGFEVADVPLKTVTFVRTVGLRGRANTYNYYISGGEYAEVEAVVNEFIAETFPDFGSI